jgi:hypothetical protein
MREAVQEVRLLEPDTKVMKRGELGNMTINNPQVCSISTLYTEDCPKNLSSKEGSRNSRC